MRLTPLYAIAIFMFAGSVMAAEETTVNSNTEKLADDPTKVTTKLGVSYANNFDFNDDNYSFSGSYAIGQAKNSMLVLIVMPANGA